MPRRSAYQRPAEALGAVWMRRKAAANAREGKSEEIEWMIGACMNETGCMRSEARAALLDCLIVLREKKPRRRGPERGQVSMFASTRGPARGIMGNTAHAHREAVQGPFEPAPFGGSPWPRLTHGRASYEPSPPPWHPPVHNYLTRAIRHFPQTVGKTTKHWVKCGWLTITANRCGTGTSAQLQLANRWRSESSARS
jgi:hypothetical protein